MNSNSFNTQNTINVVKDYLNDKTYPYAIMLDGEWGSGKTYFVKNILKDSIENKIIYISLYGIDSLDEISNAIIFSNIKNKNNKIVLASNLGINIGKLLLNNYLPKELVKVKNEVFKEIDFKEAFEDKILKDKFLIFDDLERCKLPLNEVLGYINNYVEHQNIKVMIVANENKIKENCKNYTKIKEKLISQTINYIPNLKNNIENILENSNINEELKNILKKEKTIEVCVNMMNKEQHLNLRTYQFFLSKINILYEKIFDSIEKITEKDELLLELIQILLCYSILYKKGEIIDKLDDFIKKIHLYKLIRFSTKDLEVFLNFISNSILDEKYIEEFKKSKFDILNKYNKLISNLHNYCDYFSEKEVLMQVNELLNFIEPNYVIKEFIQKYPYIIKIILELNYMNIINMNLDDIVDKMKENVKYFDDYIFFSYDLPNEYNEKIYEKISILRNEINNNFKLKIKNKFDSILCSKTNKEEWVIDFFKVIDKAYINIIGFLTNVNIDNLVLKIYISSPKQINDFFNNIKSKVYFNFEEIKELDKEKQALNNFKEKLKKHKKDNMDKIVMFQIENIINYIGG